MPMPMRLIQALFATFVALLLGFAPAAAQTYPKLTGLVVDAANVLPAATKADLTAKLEALQKDTKQQLVVATIPDLQGRELVEYGVGLGRAWGIGLNDVDNGAILFIAPNEPKGHRGPRLEVGRGLEPLLTDAFAGTMIRDDMMPLLKQKPSDVPGAMEAGTDAVIAQLRASPEEQKARVDAAAADFNRTHQRSRSTGGGLPIGLIVFGFVAMFILLSFGRRASGQRYAGRSGSDSGLMPVLLWGLANEIGSAATRGSWGGGGSGWGGGSSGGGSDGSWGGGGFTGGGGGDFGGGGASGDW